MDSIFKNYYYADDNILSNNELWKNKIQKDSNFDPNTKKKDFENWLARQETHQTTQTIHAPSKQMFHPIIAGPHTYQSDLMYYDSLAKVNGGYSAIINFVEISTRKAYSYPLKGKTSGEVFASFEEFFKSIGTLNCLEIDKGSEYALVIKFCESNGIKVIIYNNDKNSMSIAERFNRSLRSFVQKVCKDRVWYKKLPIILKAYNEKTHGSTGYSPDYLEDHPEIQDEIRSSYIQQIVEAKAELNKFKVGDSVRVYEKKKLFGKGTGSFSSAVHSITAINGNSIFLDHNPEKKYRYYNVLKVGHIDADPRVVKNDEADIEETNYKVARKLKKEMAPQLTVKEFNEQLQQKVHDETEGRGKRTKTAKKSDDFVYA